MYENVDTLWEQLVSGATDLKIKVHELQDNNNNNKRLNTTLYMVLDPM